MHHLCIEYHVERGVTSASVQLIGPCMVESCIFALMALVYLLNITTVKVLNEEVGVIKLLLHHCMYIQHIYVLSLDDQRHVFS